MAIQKTRFNINFMAGRRLAALVSGLLILLSIGALATRGLNLGIDFTGGTLVEAGYPAPVDLKPIREALAGSEFANAQIQYFGSARDILIRIPPHAGLNNVTISNRILDLLAESGQGVEMRRVEFVGPQVGEELKNDGGLALLYALIGILIYVALRFQIRFSIGAIAALVHDVLLTLGVFAITGMDFDLTVLAALLAVIGYSLNDTIVVFDRVRENFRRLREQGPVEIFNYSLNQMLGRTLTTSLTTMLVLIALLIFGGEIIHGFAMALLIGVLVGTYSSIFVASPVTLKLGISREALLPVQKEGADLDSQT